MFRQAAFGIDPSTILHISSKTGLGVSQIFPAIVDRIRPPVGDENAPLRALLFDSWFDQHRAVICLVKVVDGRIMKGDKIET